MQTVIFGENPLAPGGKILIEQPVLDVLDSFRQRGESSPEAGGILLGFRRGVHLHIVDLTVPHADDKRSRSAFHRSSGKHQQIALDRWKESGSLVDYLGEWHTHPENEPFPSAIDLREWRSIYVARPVPMGFLILGTAGQPWIGVASGGQLATISLRHSQE